MATINQINQFVNQKHIAVVGISRTPQKFGNSAFKELKKKGYSLYPVSLHMEEFEGIKCYRDIASLPAEVTAILISTKSEQTRILLSEARDKGIRHIWLQKGAADKGLIEQEKNASDNLITGHCVLMFSQPDSIHRFHGFLKKLFRSYPN